MYDDINKNKPFILLAFIFIIPFLNLGFGEIQPWDEALYAVRANSILLYGNFIDQTQNSLGGLYSSTYPPLYVWLLSLSISIGGTGNFAVRFVSAFSSGLSAVFIYLLAKRIVKPHIALLSSLILMTTICWNIYSRLAMTDIFLNMLFLFSLWSIVKFEETDLVRHKRNYSLLIGFLLTCSVMTKISISLLPLMFIVILLFFKNSFKDLKELLLSVSVSLLFGSLWYILMAISHGNDFLQSLALPHLYSVVENNSPHLGIFYYLNQLVCSNPLFLFSFVFALSFLVFNRSKLFKKEGNFIQTASIIWFLSTFLIFSLARTRMHHYTNYIVPPAILLASIFLDKIEKSDPNEQSRISTFFLNDKIRLIIIILLNSWFFWSFSILFQNAVKGLKLFSPVIIVFIFINLILSAILFINPFSLRRRLAKNLNNIAYSIVIVATIRILMLNLSAREGNFDGSSDISYYLSKSGIKSFVFLYHQHTTADSLAPQFAWYADGWQMGWQKDKSYKPIALPKENLNYAQIRRSDAERSSFLIYQYPYNNQALAKTVINELSQTRNIIFLTKSYALFGLKVAQRKQMLEL